MSGITNHPNGASLINGRNDPLLAQALTKVSPQAQAKAKATATDFEAMFLNSMLQPMFNGVNEGPFSGGQGASVWRSFLTDEYSKIIVKNGGVGIADHVYRSLLAQQEVRSAHATGAQQGSPAL